SREITTAQDRRARNPRWRSDGRALYFFASDRGQTLVYEADVDQGKVRAMFGAGDQMGSSAAFPEFRGSLDSTVPIIVDQRVQVNSFSIAQELENAEFVDGQVRLRFRSARMATIVSDPTHPSELWIGSGNVLTRVTAHNETFRGSVELVELEEFRFKSFDGTSIQGWLIKPVGWREDRKYPMILSIHGGPQGMYGYAFNPGFQAFAAH